MNLLVITVNLNSQKLYQGQIYKWCMCLSLMSTIMLKSQFKKQLCMCICKCESYVNISVLYSLLRGNTGIYWMHYLCVYVSLFMNHWQTSTSHSNRFHQTINTLFSESNSFLTYFSLFALSIIQTPLWSNFTASLFVSHSLVAKNPKAERCRGSNLIAAWHCRFP